MNREQAKEIIKRDIPCTEYLQPAPNHSGNSGYCCPICGSGTHGHGSTGAVRYYEKTNTWYCHACNEGGDTIDAYTAANGTDYNTALSFLAARAGVTIDQRTTAAEDFKNAPQSDLFNAEDKQDGGQRKQPQSANIADYSKYYEACRGRLFNPAAESYLNGRGISTETAAAFSIGYDPAADPAGAPGAMGDEYKAHPAARIIIPCSPSHYVARSIDPKTPKSYKAMNPNREKGGGAVALFNAEAIYSGADVIFITEGIFDALSFIEAGAAAVALNSKGNGKLLLSLLQERPTEAAFIIVPDNDDDPKTAADTMKRATDLNAELQRMNYKSIIYNIAGAEHDANDLLAADRALFEKQIAAAIAELNRDDLTDFLEKIQTEAYKPYQTGLNFFDNLLQGGIIQQSLLLLMAAPGTGKTTLIQQLAETMAEHQKPILYFNFEMSREQMLAKALSAKLYRNGGSKTARGILQGYNWSDEERAAILRITDEYRHNNYPYIKYNPAGASSELTELLAYLKRTGDAAKAAGRPAPAAVIDYLHLITSRDGIDTAELIKQAVTGLKQYAVEYNTFVIGIIASNRASNAKGRLTMESGRDSSNLEYTGDYILSLNYEAIDSGKVKASDVDKIAELQQQTKRLMILRVLKSRFSQPGMSTTIMFNAAYNIFYGTCDDFIPPEGFIADDGAPAWEDDSDVIMTI